MDRTIVSTGVLLTGLLMATPALAQDYVWTADRPDGHAPAGVKADYLLGWGNLYVGFRYFTEQYRGTLVGTQPISDLEVLDFFTVAPLELDRSIAEAEVRFGLLPFLTVEGSVPFIRNEMLSETDLLFFESSSQVIGDISLRGLVDLLDMDGYRLTGHFGVSVPFGNLGKRGTTSVVARGVLPFAMQGGSGTWDILAGGTFLAQNETSSIGAQINSVTRFMTNGKGYRLGDRIDFSIWGAYNLSGWASVSLRGFYENWGDITGSDFRTDGLVDPGANQFAQGGERVVIPFGLNIYLREGMAAGHRLSIEFYYPVHEDLNGPQLSVNSALVASWQTIF